MAKIALIGCGGTIGMMPNAEGTLVPAQGIGDIFKHVPIISDLAEITLVPVTDKDSTNMSVQDWRTIAQTVGDLHKDYDAMVVTHGTDTMTYTATATAIALGNKLQKPVIFTGSQLPITEVGTDARANLERSILVAIEAAKLGLRETMIFFYDKLLRASRTIKESESAFSAFASPAYPDLGKFSATGIWFNPLAERRLTERTMLSADPNSSINIETGFSDGVATIDMKPSLRPELVRAIAQQENCGGLILKSLGAGNVPSQGEYSLIPVIEETVHDLGKPVVIATKFVGGNVLPELYETGKLAAEVGAGNSGDMTDVAAEVKLSWLLGRGITDVEAVNYSMLNPIAGEIS